MQSDSKRFLRKVALLAISFYAVTLVVSTLFNSAVNWRTHQDPRRRLLWDSHTEDADIVLLGDSVFVSSFVDSATDLLPNVLERLTGKRVFNAALTGADPPDFLKAAKLLETNGTRNTYVILDIIPTRFLAKKHPDPPAGNYPGEFAERVGDNWFMDVIVKLRKPLFVLDRDLLFDTIFHRASLGTGEYKNRVWNTDGDLARERFDTFEMEAADSDPLQSFEWISELQSTFNRSNNKLVILITPLNSWLIKTYATDTNAVKYLRRFAESRNHLIAYLDEHHIPYIDGTRGAASDDFGDLIHPNGSGNRYLANLITGYFTTKETGLIETKAVN